MAFLTTPSGFRTPRRCAPACYSYLPLLALRAEGEAILWNSQE